MQEQQHRRLFCRIPYFLVVALLFLMTIGGSVHASVLEFLESNLWCHDVQRFIDADSRIWTTFLSSQPGFKRKQVMRDPRGAESSNCTVTMTILWESRELWKSVDPKLLAATNSRFAMEFGYEPMLVAKPSHDGYDVVAEFLAPSTPSAFAPTPTGVIVGVTLGCLAFVVIAV